MALTITDRGLAKTTGGVSATNTITSASFTPGAGDCMAVIVGGMFNDGGSSTVFSVTDTHAGTGTWVERVVATVNAGSGYHIRAAIWTAAAGATPGAGTITVTRTAGSIEQWMVADFPSIAGGWGIGTTGSNANVNTTTTCAITLGAAPASTSLLIGGIIDNNGADPITHPSGWTELQDVAEAPVGEDYECAYINTGGSQTFNWSALGTSGFGRASVALEITETASPITGTVAVTLAAFTSSVSGTVLGPPPTLSTPADDATVNLVDGETFTWSHNGAGAQTDFAFRRRGLPGPGAWEYWTGSAWQAGEVFIASATESVTFDAGDWS